MGGTPNWGFPQKLGTTKKDTPRRLPIHSTWGCARVFGLFVHGISHADQREVVTHEKWGRATMLGRFVCALKRCLSPFPPEETSGAWPPQGTWFSANNHHGGLITVTVYPEPEALSTVTGLAFPVSSLLKNDMDEASAFKKPCVKHILQTPPQVFAPSRGLPNILGRPSLMFPEGTMQRMRNVLVFRSPCFDPEVWLAC